MRKVGADHLLPGEIEVSCGRRANQFASKTMRGWGAQRVVAIRQHDGLRVAEVARKARQQRPDLPIIFASGYSETTAVEAAMGEHARLPHKPFKVHELQSACHERLSVPTND